MIEKNQFYSASVADFGCDGEGIVKLDGYTVFVPGALKGEDIELKIVKVLKTHGYGKLMKVNRPSPFRREPQCPYFRRCGGCQMLHIDLSEQLRLKQAHVESCFRKYAGISVKVNPVVGMDDPYHYRNKAQYPIEGTQAGFYAPRSHDLIPIDRCLMQQPQDEAIIQAVLSYLKQTGASIRNLFIRHGDNCSMVVLVSKHRNLPQQELLVQKIRFASSQVTSIIHNYNPKDTNVILGQENTTLFGCDTITGRIDSLTFEISPHSFFQVNPLQTEVLYRIAKNAAGLTGTETILDLYCGIGTIGLFFADSVKRVIGVESVPQAVEDATKNAKRNQIKNAEFYCGLAEEILPQLIQKGISPDLVILDPPRKGCDPKLISSLMDLNPPKILYISCNPATLARDVAALCSSYCPRAITPVDMFPHTKHVETVCLLSKLH